MSFGSVESIPSISTKQILFACHWLKMGRVNTWAITALMVELKAGEQWAVSQFIDDAMGSDSFSTAIKLAEEKPPITIDVNHAFPNPTIGKAINFRIFGEYLSKRFH
jgi:hypothetical protein